ncbi:hypothetical protein [Bradyrhizobium cenepequi]|uniref:hypothetical protein n=1 Tax=Bradyrhizobium cenepequi TaxID=2821403 RepID=UPI001CE368E1|nr:hypothetical protein [Bradyrhizobium cenepequi]MCA6108295.1 hypothetical protein [Bradyrhizobium cenepequi]
MTDRENSPAYRMLPCSARQALAAIEQAIGGGDSASVSYLAFRLDHCITQKVVSRALPMLVNLGLIEIERGPRGSNVFRLSNCWRSIDEVEAKRLAELVREVKPHRTFESKAKSSDGGKPSASSTGSTGTVSRPEKRRQPTPVKLPKPITVERRPCRRRVPSLPTMPWQDDGR